MTKERLAYFYLALTILLWSAVPAVAKLALAELNNLQILFFNNIIGIISLSAAAILMKKTHHFSEYRAWDYLRMFGMGFLGLYLYYILLYGSFSQVPAGQANMINYLWPVFVVIFSILILKEKASFKTFLAILLSFIGALIVFSRGDLASLQNDAHGYLLAFGAAVSYGLFSVVGKKLRYEKFTSMLVFYVSSLILITPTVFLFSKFALPQSLTTLLALIFLGGMANSLGFVFWFKALEKGRTHKIANMAYLTPFLATVWVYFLNNEVIPLISFFGLILIVGGILLQLKEGKNK